MYDPAGSQFFLRNSNDSGFAQRVFVYGPANFSGTPLAGAWNTSTVTGLTPATGSAAGGDSVKIAGTGFTGATAVKFGTTAATTFHVDSATQITATSPGGTAGAVDVTVTTIGGTSAVVSADKFTYVAAPAVTAVASTTAKGTYAPGAIIPITVTFGTAVTVTGTPTLDLNSKGTNTSAKATYASTSADGLTLTFNYAVAAGDSTASGQFLDYTSTSALALSGGTIVNKAAPTINATLTLPATGTDGLAAQQIVISAAPTVLALSSTTAKGTYGPGTVIPITVTFSAGHGHYDRRNADTGPEFQGHEREREGYLQQHQRGRFEGYLQLHRGRGRQQFDGSVPGLHLDHGVGPQWRHHRG